MQPSEIRELVPIQLLPQTPLGALGPYVRERVRVASRTFLIERPQESEHLLAHPDVRAAFEIDEFLPYWTELWPASRMLARAVLQERWPTRQHVLELGCGLGLPGVAALSVGHSVTFNDCDLTALHFAANNAHLNGFCDFEVLHFDWRNPPYDRQFDVVVASDVIYELRHINPLVAIIQTILRPGGFCLLTDQDRLPAYNLTDALIGEGLPYSARAVRAGTPGGRRVKGTLYRINVPG
jgi:predicted nicotinamide N-methyase